MSSLQMDNVAFMEGADLLRYSICIYMKWKRTSPREEKIWVIQRNGP